MQESVTNNSLAQEPSCLHINKFIQNVGRLWKSSKQDLVRHVRMFEERVNAEHGVVRLDARRRDLRARPNRERDFRLLAVVDGEALEEQAAETGASAATAGVEDHEAYARVCRGFSLADAHCQCRHNHTDSRPYFAVGRNHRPS